MTAPEGKREFRILGPFEARKNGRALEIGAGKQRALLAFLLLDAGAVVSTDRLIDALWGERPPASALNSVHVYVSQLRKVLGEGCLLTRGHGYLLALEPEQVDLGRFERMLGEGRELLAAGEATRASGVLQAALALWRGPPLADLASEPFAQGEIARLDELHLAALEERIEADLALGRHDQLVPELEALVRANPLRERLRAQLMLALYRSGRQAEALEAYRQGRMMLVQEVGLEPGRRLQELERAILSQDPALDPPAPAAAPLPPGRPADRDRRHSPTRSGYCCSGHRAQPGRRRWAREPRRANGQRRGCARCGLWRRQGSRRAHRAAEGGGGRPRLRLGGKRRLQRRLRDRPENEHGARQDRGPERARWHRRGR
jgi:DNA-binding SARP family transcriptional activator